MTLYKGIPAHAERIAFDAVIGTRSQPSRFAPSVKAVVGTVKCVGCDTVHVDPDLTKTIRCNCGLSTRCEGVLIYIWREKERADVRA